MVLRRIIDCLREADLRLFRKISGWRSTRFRWGRPRPATPLERLMLWLSLGANMSRIWFAAAAVLFKFGGRSGKRAGIRGLASIGVTSAIVNFLIKPLVKRKRPARDRILAARQLVREPLDLVSLRSRGKRLRCDRRQGSPLAALEFGFDEPIRGTPRPRSRGKGPPDGRPSTVRRRRQPGRSAAFG